MLSVPKQIRTRFFAAFRTLRPEKVTITSTVYHPRGVGAGNLLNPVDMRALAQLLLDWPLLKSLMLRGYRFGRPSLGGFDLTSNKIAEYCLVELVLRDIHLPDNSLNHLVRSAGLTSLTLKLVTGIPTGVLEAALQALGPTLVRLTITSAEEDLAPLYEPEVLLPLVKLEKFHLYLDGFFPDTVLGVIASFPSIEEVEVNMFAISHRNASAALANPSSSLRNLDLGEYESGEPPWDVDQRWAFAKLCKSRGVALVLSGYDFDDLENGKSVLCSVSFTTSL